MSPICDLCMTFTSFVQITDGLVNNGIEAKDIGIITPYNSQANLIRHACVASVETHTIDKYQVRLKLLLSQQYKFFILLSTENIKKKKKEKKSSNTVSTFSLPVAIYHFPGKRQRLHTVILCQVQGESQELHFFTACRLAQD